MYIDDINLSGSIVSTPELSALLSSMEIFPNPSADKMTLDFDLEETSEVGIEILDLPGRILSQVSHQQFAAGNHSITINHQLPDGIYFLRITLNGRAGSQKFVVANFSK